MSFGTWRYRVASGLRFLGHAALLAFVIALFHQPLTAILGNQLKAVDHRLGLASWLSPSAAKGFLINATSTPTGGTLLIDDTPRGTTPTVSNVACSEGQSVKIKVKREGFAGWENTVSCREGKTLIIRARLTPKSN